MQKLFEGHTSRSTFLCWVMFMKEFAASAGLLASFSTGFCLKAMQQKMYQRSFCLRQTIQPNNKHTPNVLLPVLVLC